MRAFALRLYQYPVYLSSILLFGFGAIAIPFDKPFSHWLHESTMSIDWWLQLITAFGDGRLLIPSCLIIGVLLFFVRRRLALVSVSALLAVLVSGAATHVLKSIFGRPRPYTEGDVRYKELYLEVLQWFTLNKDFASFPSGHTTAIFAFTWTFASQIQNKRFRLALMMFASIVALSRVALAKHYLADVISGAAVGIIFAQLFIELILKRFSRSTST